MAKKKPELEIGQVLWVIPYYYDNEFDGFKEPKKCQVIEFDGYYFKVDEYVCEFDIENEKPICVNCFHDLEHDAFANYHCSGCDEWFTESEVLRFQP